MTVERFFQDVRYALRLMRKSPGFTAIAIFTLAIGIGVNTAIFSVTDAVLLRPLPYTQPNRLIRVWQSEPRMGELRLGTAPPEFVAYRDGTRAFSRIAGYYREGFDFTSDGDSEHIPGCRATASLFSTLGVPPAVGRTFTAQEELPGAAKVVVLSYRYWKRHYSESPQILGTVIRLNEQPYRIVGVMPRGFTFPATDATPGEPPDLWLPLSFTSRQLSDWASSFETQVIARLRDDVSLPQARDDVRRVAAQFQRDHPNVYSGSVRLDATAEHWAPDYGERVPVVLSMLCGAVGFVLLIACANVANLLLARAGARQREISIRRALGASPTRLMRQMLTETALLAVAGGALGSAFAYGLIRVGGTILSTEVNLGAANVDARVLWFTFGLSGAVCLLCGLAPAWSVRRPDVNDALKQSARQSGRVNRRLGRLLIFAEIACSVVLLIGSGLLLRSFLHVLQVPLGFDPERVLIVRTALNRQRYASPDRRHEVERTIVTRLSSLPGVSAVGLTTHVPLADERQIGFVLDGHPSDEFHWADNALVSGEYFRVMGIPLLSGRTFSDADTAKSPTAAIINLSMARQYWPGGNALGKGLKWGGRQLTVVGIVGDIHIQGLDKPVGPTIYNSVYQVESGATTSGVFVIRTQSGQDSLRFAAAAQSTIRSVDRGLPVLGSNTLHQVVASSLAIRRISLALGGSFALIAVVLSLIGIYGVLSHAITQRTHEMGIRLALGARPIEITGLVVGEGVRLTIWGVVVGTAGGALAATSISTLLFGIRALDPVSFVCVVVLILAVSLLASYLPARRAARVDPMVALRYE